MKKYTTLLCLLLALVMVMACFTGCAKRPAQSDPADTTEPAQTTDTTPEDSTPAEPADTRETVNIRFAQFGTNLGEIVNADPDRYPTLYKMMNSEEWKAYNKL